MSDLTLILYVIVLGLWYGAIRREGGIGLGCRFLIPTVLAIKFLLGPLMSYVFDVPYQFKTPSDPDWAVQLILWSYIALWFGAFIGPRLVLGYRRLSIPADWTPFRPLLRTESQWLVGKKLVVYGLGAVLVAPVMYRIPTVRAIWGNVMDLTVAGLAMMCLSAVHRGDRRRVLMVLGVLVAQGVGRAIVAGYMMEAMVTALLLSGLIFLAEKFNVKTCLAFVLVGYLALIPYGLWITVRKDLRTAIGQQTSVSQRIEVVRATDKATPLSMLAVWDPNTIEIIRQRTDYFPIFASTVVHTPAQEPYARGETFVDNILIAMIPRALWPEKPLQMGGTRLVERFTGMHFQGVSVEVSYFFEFYVNFGPAGMMIGMAILGLVLGLMDYLYFTRAPNSLAWEYTTLMCLWSITIMDEISRLAMVLPVALFVCWSVNRWLNAKFPGLQSIRAGLHAPVMN